MRILQVCPYDWHAPGGVQTHVRELAAALRTRGHDVCVAAPGRSQSDDDRLRIVASPCRIPFNGTTAPVAPQPTAAWRVRQVLRSFRPDLVHVHEPLAPSIAGYAGLLASVPVVATFHAHCDTPIGPWLYRLGTWPMNRHVSAGLAVSEAALRCVSSRVRVPFRVVPNGVGASWFALADRRRISRRPVIVFAHRLEPRKGFDVALKAFARLCVDRSDMTCVVVGDGPERWRVDALPAQVRARIDMRGTVSHDALLGVFAEATMFLAPAVHGESFGIALAEALAAGVPVIASDVPGYRDVVGDAGVLVPAGRPDALAAAVLDLLGSPVRQRALAESGRRRAECYAWHRIVAEIETVYGEAMASATAVRQRAAI